MKPIHVTLEPCVHNTDGSSCTVYFEGPSTMEDALAAFNNPENKGKFGCLGPDLDMGDPWELKNGLTEALKLSAWQCCAG